MFDFNRVSLTSQKSIELDKQFQINIVALGSLAVALAHMVLVQINS